MAEALVGCSCKDSSGFACTSQQTREDSRQQPASRRKKFRCWSDGIAHAKRNEKRAKNSFPTYSPQRWNRQLTFFTIFFAMILRVKKSYFSLFL
jgi:hypothetical protein